MISKRTAAIIDIILMVLLVGTLLWYARYILAAILTACWMYGAIMTIRKNKKIQ